MKSDRDRGPIGAWARRERIAHGWSDVDVSAQLEKRGVRLLASSYRGIEAGPQPPSNEVIHGLEAVFGSEAPSKRPKEEAAEPQLSDLIAAMRAQTDALNALAARLDMSVEAQRGQTEGMVQAMTELVGVLRPARVRRESPRGSSSGTQP